ncbi:hypothetical protein AF332_05060 [Sporosarcina globispora]|uniref:Uncharacterized protein n=1 Tax=Sporosarcina globispora TaxID=1459 RepID=A0A0M0G8T7_SPOGL|nr:hypothetical protein AF332_05060 [Sporosarcina globispora]
MDYSKLVENPNHIVEEKRPILWRIGLFKSLNSEIFILLYMHKTVRFLSDPYLLFLLKFFNQTFD